MMMVRVQVAAVMFALKRIEVSQLFLPYLSEERICKQMTSSKIRLKSQRKSKDDGRRAKNACSEREKALRLQYEKRNIILVVGHHHHQS